MRTRTYEEPTEAVKAVVLGWLLDPKMHERGRPSCPCGFIGGSRNILRHRGECEYWGAYSFMHRWHGEERDWKEVDE
jgi:hypothetical protein